MTAARTAANDASHPAAGPTKITLDVWPVHAYRPAEPESGFVWMSDSAEGHWMPGWMNGRDCGFADEHYWRARGFVPVYFAPTPPPPDEWRET